MKLNIFFPFFKNKGELNTEDKLQTSFAGRSSSAWSYSYDLNITERFEAAMRLRKETHHSEIDFEDKHLGLNVDEDLDDYIFQKSPDIHELTLIERIISASQVIDKINQKNEDYPQNSQRKLKPPTEVSVHERLNDVARLRLSDMQNQRSWLDRITKPFPKDNKDEMKPENMEKQRQKYQIQSVLIEYLQLFIQKTALPTIQKYEQLKKKYSNEKKEWTKKAEFLERQNYWLKSELQNFDKSYSGPEEEFTNLKKIDSQNPSRIDVKRNFLLPVPEYDEIRRSLDFDLEAIVIPDVNSYVSLEPECQEETEKFTDFKLGYYSQADHVELEDAVSVNESQLYYKDFRSTKEKLEKSHTLNRNRKLGQESLQSRNILLLSKNNFSPDGPENFKADNGPFGNCGINTEQGPRISQSSSLTKLDYLSPLKGTFSVDASRDHRVCQSRTVQGATAYVPGVGEWTRIKVSCETQDLRKSKVKRLPKNIIDQYALEVSDSWYLQKRNKAADTLDSRVLKVEKEKGDVSEKICSVNTYQSADFRNQYSMGNTILKKSISGSTIRSMWL